ncbi:MAG TPA: hypothetical protein PK018_00200 [Candidatus Competibacter sp.]|nr:hypothetical protein [Candidatus Competibacteraceae bacterium]HPE70585.1 hypothetical protein [Candidatus Competibacter sp.]
MQVPKLKVLIEAGVVREVEVLHDAAADGWTVRVSYATRAGERIEVLERQRGGVRVFATLDAVARGLAGLGLPAFRVHAAGLTGEEPP